MKLLLDEMHAPGIADSLTDQSFDVVAVAAQPGLRGMPDEDLLTYATNHDRVLVTENVADFMPLAAQWAGAGKAHAGLIFTNPRRFNRANLAYPGNVVVALNALLSKPPITGKSWTWWL
ncbi:MAG TPA: DUF5615 family PIN-like protein [Acidimicrobiia bacterium]|nr:DUF5615 family PIN-like protein [Acidimicrobiia bacterium]